LKKKTYEDQYEIVFQVEEKFGRSKFGLMSNESWNQDPKRLVFTLSRYKFVAKMISGSESVLEVGCADAFGTRIVQQEVNNLTAIDIDPIFINDSNDRMSKHWPFDCYVHDMLAGPTTKKFDAAYSLDVLEHISSSNEDLFLSNIVASLNKNGVLLIGMPSLESQAYASPQSKIGHVNCKSGPDLKNLLKKYFYNVFLFSMNDEVVHTGFSPMANYLLCVCAGIKKL